MIYASEFQDGGQPLGAVMPSYNYSAPQYEMMLGQRVSRGVRPRLSTLFPVGALTGTLRTLAAIPTAVQVIATANHFVAAGANTALAIQYSADGAAWLTTATPSMTVVQLLATPFRLVALNSSAALPAVTSSLVPNSTWTTTTAGPGSVAAGSSFCRLVHIPTHGRVLAVHTTSGFYTLDDAGTVWVARTWSGPGGTRQGACFTGNRVICVLSGTALLGVSVDGAVTWTDATLPEATSSSQGNIASNGAGVVVVSGSPSGLQVSLDHGVTWFFVQIPGVPVSDLWRVQFSDGMFFVPTAQGLAMSIDGKRWFIDTEQYQPMNVNCSVAKRGNLILANGPSGTTAYTLSISTTEFKVPLLQLTATALNGTGAPTVLAPYMIKAV